MFALALLAATVLSPTAPAPQEPPTPAVRWTTNRLGAPVAQRSLADKPIALAAPPTAGDFRVKITATRHAGDGTLVLAIPRGEGTPAFFTAITDADGRALVELEVRGDDVRMIRGARNATPSDVKLPTDARICAWASTGTFQLDAVYFQQGAPRQPNPRTAANAAAAAKADPLERLGNGSRWKGTYTGDQSEIDCVIVVLERTATTLAFRLELENGARFRVDCKVVGGKLVVDTITHTKSATNGQLRVITDEKGGGTVSPTAFALDYTFHSELPNKKETLRGKIRIEFP